MNTIFKYILSGIFILIFIEINAQCVLEEAIRVDNLGRTVFKKSIVYDKRKNIISEIIDNKGFLSKKLFQYNTQNQLIKIENYTASKLVSVDIIDPYNQKQTKNFSDNNLQEDIEIMPADIVLKTTIDGNRIVNVEEKKIKQNKLIYKIEKNQDGIITYILNNSYDANNNLIVSLSEDKIGNVSSKKTYEYQNNKLIKTLEYRQGILSEYTINAYQNSNIVKAIQYAADGTEKFTIVNEYIKGDLLSKTTAYQGNQLLNSTEYVYDAQKNLIEEISKNNQNTINQKTSYAYNCGN